VGETKHLISRSFHDEMGAYSGSGRIPRRRRWVDGGLRFGHLGVGYCSDEPDPGRASARRHRRPDSDADSGLGVTVAPLDAARGERLCRHRAMWYRRATLR
jgi:hypothetical protein